MHTVPIRRFFWKNQIKLEIELHCLWDLLCIKSLLSDKEFIEEVNEESI